MANFEQANSTNLPQISQFMCWKYIKDGENYSLSEIRGAKADKAMRPSYVNSAVGYVKLKRSGTICTVSGEVCPEHKTARKNYAVELIVDEKEEKILSVECKGCVASKGGCKHSLAFLSWMSMRSAEPATTEVKSYWAKPHLSNVGRKQHATCQDFGADPFPQLTKNIEPLLNNLPSSCLFKRNLNDSSELQWNNIDMHYLVGKFKTENTDDYFDFLNFLKSNINGTLANIACDATKEQYRSPLWYSLRYGRITASILYSATRCKKSSGVLVEQILGADSVPETIAMKQGKEQEEEIIKVLQNQFKITVEKTGFLVSVEYPEFGASPDGVGFDFVVEVKSPFKESTIKSYIDEKRNISKKYLCQVQLQMLIFKKKKCYFVVADPNFKSNKNITVKIVQFDEEFIIEEIENARHFFKTTIFPRLLNRAIL